MRTVYAGMGVTGPLVMVNLLPCKMSFCCVYLRSGLPCILGPRFWITNSCSGTWPSAKVLPAGFLTPFWEHFQQELLGGKQERLPHSLVSKSVRASWSARAERWQMGWLVDFLHWQTETGIGRNHRLLGDQPPTCRHLRAERPHYHPHRQLEPLWHSETGCQSSWWGRTLEEAPNPRSFVWLSLSVWGADVFSPSRDVSGLSPRQSLQFLRQLTPLSASPFLTLPQQLACQPPTHMSPSCSHAGVQHDKTTYFNMGSSAQLKYFKIKIIANPMCISYTMYMIFHMSKSFISNIFQIYSKYIQNIPNISKEFQIYCTDIPYIPNIAKITNIPIILEIYPKYPKYIVTIS